MIEVAQESIKKYRIMCIKQMQKLLLNDSDDEQEPKVVQPTKPKTPVHENYFQFCLEEQNFYKNKSDYDNPIKNEWS